MELQSMDLAEVRNLVKWLDEQQRKGRQELAVLQQKHTSHQAEMTEVVNRINELGNELSDFQARVTRLSQVDQKMENLKAEIVNLVQQNNDKRVQSEREMERLRLVEHEALKRSIDEIQPSIPIIGRLEEQLGQRKVENERLSTAIGVLQNQLPSIEARIDERSRDVAFLEEKQRQDTRRISELGQSLIQTQKRTDSGQSKDLILEDAIRRNEATLSKLKESENERKQQVIQFIEQAKLNEQRQNQQLARWNEQLEDFNELMAGYAKQWRVFEEQNRLSREATAGLLEFKDGLELRQQEVSELQRVSSERIKNLWDEFLDEDEKRQKQRQLQAEQWSIEQKRSQENFETRFYAVQESLDYALEEIKRLFTLQEKYADAFRQFSRIWMEGYESIVSPPITRKIPG